jgi:ethanolamine-phosphate cytidylyltransferase
MSATDPKTPPGDAAPEILEERIWIDGCFDFFHHGKNAQGRLASLKPY